MRPLLKDEKEINCSAVFDANKANAYFFALPRNKTSFVSWTEQS